MNWGIGFVFGLLFAVLVTTWGIDWPDDIDDQNKEIAEYFKSRKVGFSTDYTVMKHGSGPVITVYGFLSDRQVCDTLAQTLQKQGGRYSCQPAN